MIKNKKCSVFSLITENTERFLSGSNIVDKDRIFLFYLIIGVRVNHVLLNFRPCGIHSHISAISVQKRKGKNETEGHYGGKQEIIYEPKEDNTNKSENISLETEGNKDKGILQNLEDGEIEGDKYSIDVKSHYKIYYGNKQAGVEHHGAYKAKLHIEEMEESAVY